MLTLFPFEAKFYEKHAMPVEFVGHPLANMIPLEADQASARSDLGLPQGQRIVALMPGSRGGELKYLAQPFLDTARWLLKRHSDLIFVMPAANQQRFDYLRELLDRDYSDLPIELVLKRSREVMTAADAVLLASGTATLEALLLKKPMVVAYRFTKLTYAIMSRMIKVPYVSLPNLLAKKALVPELIQDSANPDALAGALIESWKAFHSDSEMAKTFDRLHHELRLDAGNQAAQAVLELVNKKAG